MDSDFLRLGRKGYLAKPTLAANVHLSVQSWTKIILGVVPTSCPWASRGQSTDRLRTTSEFSRNLLVEGGVLQGCKPQAFACSLGAGGHSAVQAIRSDGTLPAACLFSPGREKQSAQDPESGILSSTFGSFLPQNTRDLVDRLHRVALETSVMRRHMQLPSAMRLGRRRHEWTPQRSHVHPFPVSSRRISRRRHPRKLGLDDPGSGAPSLLDERLYTSPLRKAQAWAAHPRASTVLHLGRRATILHYRAASVLVSDSVPTLPTDPSRPSHAQRGWSLHFGTNEARRGYGGPSFPG